MSEQRRYDARDPEAEGVPDFDEDLESRRKIPDYDEGTELPGDRPLGSRDLVTAQEQREGESLGTRLAREVPDEPRPRREPVGRLYEEPGDDGDDVNKELVAEETDDTSGLSPEESALHIVEEDDEL